MAVIRTAKHPPEDSPAPYVTTPRRESDALLADSAAVSAVAMRIRRHGAFVPEGRMDRVFDLLLRASVELADLATAVLVGEVPIVAYRDEQAGRGVRPILDAIESRANGSGHAGANGKATPAEPAPEKPARITKRDRAIAAAVKEAEAASREAKRPKREKLPPIAPDSPVARAIHAMHTNDTAALAAMEAAGEIVRPKPLGRTAPAEPPAPALPSWMVYHGPKRGPFDRITRVQAADLAGAIAAARERIGWQVYNFPKGIVIDDESRDPAQRAMVRIAADREWLPVEEREPYGTGPEGTDDVVSIRGDGKDKVPDVLPDGTARVYRAYTNARGVKMVLGTLKATSKAGAIATAGRLYPATGIHVEPMKEETAARQERKRERGARVLQSELERDGRSAAMRLEHSAPGEPEPPASEPWPPAEDAPGDIPPKRRRGRLRKQAAEAAGATA